MTLALHELGGDGPALACLHGVTGHGRHFAGLAAALPFRVLAPDLRGHGASPYEPPWSLEQHVEDVLATVGDAPRLWLGHSFGGRLVVELAARHPERVDRIVLLDPAVRLPPHVGLTAAENARPDRSYGSFAEAIDRRYEESVLAGAPRALLEAELAAHLVEDRDGRWRYRYCQSAVVAAYGELTREPPPFPRVPTLLVLGDTSYLPYDSLLDGHRAAVGDLLEVVVVRGGHTVLWDAAAATADAVRAFLTA